VRRQNAFRQGGGAETIRDIEAGVRERRVSKSKKFAQTVREGPQRKGERQQPAEGRVYQNRCR
jgi:hypothetical protein